MQGQPDDPDHYKMGRIINVKEPLHASPFTLLSVIRSEDRYRKECEHLERSVELIQENEIDRRIYKCPYDYVGCLALELSSVSVQKERTHYRDAGPVRRERDQADGNDHQYLRPHGNFFFVANEYQHRSPRQRPHDTCLIEESCRKRKKRYSKREIICQMRYYGKNEQSDYIFPQVMRMVIPFSYEEPHDGCGKSSDDMKAEHIPDRLCPGEKSPGQVVYGHCSYCYYLYLI